MIVRPVEGGTVLVRQSDHARHSALIAAYLKDEYLPPHADRPALFEAIRLHDIGWDSWENGTPTQDDLGLPLNFDSLEKEEHRSIMEHGIFELLRTHGPVTAAWIARHSEALMQGYPEDWILERQSMVAALAQRAWGKNPDVDPSTKLQSGAYALRLVDALSLIGLAGWGSRLEFPVPEGLESQGLQSLQAWYEAGVAVRVDPWPFLTASIPAVTCPGVYIPKGMEGDSLAIFRNPRNYAVTVKVSYFPAAAGLSR